MNVIVNWPKCSEGILYRWKLNSDIQNKLCLNCTLRLEIFLCNSLHIFIIRQKLYVESNIYLLRIFVHSNKSCYLWTDLNMLLNFKSRTTFATIWYCSQSVIKINIAGDMFAKSLCKYCRRVSNLGWPWIRQKYVRFAHP